MVRTVFSEGGERFGVVGSGSLGGKARGLMDVADVLADRFPPGRFPGVTVEIPRMVVLSTSFFDAFMEVNHLGDLDVGSLSDDRIAHAFVRGEIPPRYVGDLRGIAEAARAPLAVRSSSLLEDALDHPLAGVYATKMTPNHQPDADTRFRRLAEAVKFVLASTFFADARRYRASLPGPLPEEKMGVVIQEVVGDRRNDRYYPTISGVGRSWNFYPSGHARPEDGVLDLALGLGKTIVDGGRAWSICPAWPRTPPPWKTMGELVKHTQTRFWAVHMGRTPAHDPMRETEWLVEADLSDADYDNTLRYVASTWDPERDRLLPTVSVPGARVIDFAPILQLGSTPLLEVVREILEVAREHVQAAAEVEFAAVLDRRMGVPLRLGFLQVRPMAVVHEPVEVPDTLLSGPGLLLVSSRALGNGVRDDIRDVVWLDPDAFERPRTQEMTREIEGVNASLVREGRPYLLLGFGRWGTTDPWYGVPVDWSQISGARVVVEAALPEGEADLSQGSHFFHNMTAFQVMYLAVRRDEPIDWSWLAAQPEIARGRFVRHVRCARPLQVRVDGRSGRGVVIHDEERKE
ncbi:MAG: hypothetical protein JXB39_00310 [Deltaproteobacteria bacterium]|nr:hypothetical protein [Deltaproteobacteria bacterium]